VDPGTEVVREGFEVVLEVGDNRVQEEVPQA
jgi:hypothetical protein